MMLPMHATAHFHAARGSLSSGFVCLATWPEGHRQQAPEQCDEMPAGGRRRASLPPHRQSNNEWCAERQWWEDEVKPSHRRGRQ